LPHGPPQRGGACRLPRRPRRDEGAEPRGGRPPANAAERDRGQADAEGRGRGVPPRPTPALAHAPARSMKPPTPLRVWLACLTPAVGMTWDGFHDRRGVKPTTEITHRTGRWTLILLLVTLAFTPVRRITGWNRLIRWRRTVGLFAFFYATLHFANYV